jgi:hypothetical protein
MAMERRPPEMRKKTELMALPGRIQSIRFRKNLVMELVILEINLPAHSYNL